MLSNNNLRDFFLVFVICAFALLIFYIKRIYTYWQRRGIFTPPDFILVFGHRKLEFGRTPFAHTISQLYRDTQEPFIGIYLIIGAKLLLRDPELIRTILIKDFAYFTDRGVPIDEEQEPLSGHLFGLPGPKWRKLRTRLTPTFTSGKLKAMFPTLLKCGDILQNYLDNLAESSELLDVKEISASHSTNIISSIGFGIDVDTINNPDNEFRVCGRAITQSNFKVALRRLFVFVAPKLSRFFGLRFDDLSIENFIMSVVKENLEYREKNRVVRKDFFQLLIQLRNNGIVQLDDEWETAIKTDENQKTMTLNEMAAQVFVFFLAGFETSSSTLSFCLYELAKNKDIQQRVHNEIDQVLAQHNGQITYESISEMKFLDQCIDETLRLYPILPVLSRRCVQDYRIPGTDKIIEKGIEVFIPVMALQRDEKYYKNPNDFYPDRFNDENPAGKDQINQPYLPFGDGPRNCIGLRLGKMQTKASLVIFLHKYYYELEDRLKNWNMEFDPNVIMLSPVGGMNLKIFKR